MCRGKVRRKYALRRLALRCPWLAPAALMVITMTTCAADSPRPLPSLLTLRSEEPAWTSQEEAQGYVVYSDTYLVPFLLYQTPQRSQIGPRLSCRLAQDEYEPVMIGVYALDGGEALSNVGMEVSLDLPVTIRTVEFRDHWRPWFQPPQRELSEYADLKVPDVGMPLGDTIETILPGTTRSFWLTFHAPPGTAPGRYEGFLRIAPEGRPPTDLPLTVTVLPFVLPRADIAYGLYSYAVFSLAQQEEYQRKMYQDMIAHGMTSVTVNDSESEVDPAADSGEASYRFGPRGELEFRLIEETGLRPDGLPIMLLDYKVVGWHPAHRRYFGEEETAAAAEAIRRAGEDLGSPDLVLYLHDEPAVDQPPEYHQWAEAWKKSPGVTGTAMSTPAASQLGHLHDVQIVHVGGITPELIAEARRAGSEVWTYHFSLGHSSPLANRYYAGLYTWGLGVTGNFGWIYFHGGDEYIQPAADDILPKPSYEGLREGINDYRYLRLLEQCLAASQDSPIAEEARAWLDSLRAGADWEFYHEGFEPGHRSYFLRPAPEMAPRDYDRMRARAVEYIQALGVPDPLAQLPAGPASRAAKFEASPFLERSVSECVEGLRSPDMYTRRAAAAALALRGEEGAPAVAELIRQATDPQVRLQAFRALKAIGVAAASAAPVLGEQLEDPDAFVRLGAAYALGGLGEAAVEPLRLALYDGNPSVVQAACAALGRIGPAAASAVPELIVLLGGPSDDPTRHVGELTASHTRAAVEAITGIGPGAAAAVPALVKLYQRDTTGHERRYHPREAEALAAIGPAAAEAIPVLEQAAYSYDWEGLYCLACGASTIYALYVLRGDEADLHALADLLTAPGRHGLKAASLLEKLGERARPAEAKVRSRLEVAREEEDQQMIPLLESILANLAD